MTFTESASILADVDLTDLLTAADEAILVGVAESTVSRARKADLSHPINQGGAAVVKVGRRTYVRSEAVRSYWEQRWAGLSADDLVLRRKRPAPAQETTR